MKLRILLIVACIYLVALAGVSTAGMNQQKRAGTFARLRAAQLTETDAANIIYMRQEEKLARDVYITLNEIWDAPVFGNIIASEQRHMDALKNLIDLYNLEDPITDNTVGEFDNSEFADLYDYFVEKGTINNLFLDALNVGVSIETLDVADLQEKLEQTTAINVKRVFSNLLAGSEKHLAAFQRCIDNYDAECQLNCLGGAACTQARNRDCSCINNVP